MNRNVYSWAKSPIPIVRFRGAQSDLQPITNNLSPDTDTDCPISIVRFRGAQSDLQPLDVDFNGSPVGLIERSEIGRLNRTIHLGHSPKPTK